MTRTGWCLLAHVFDNCASVAPVLPHQPSLLELESDAVVPGPALALSRIHRTVLDGGAWVDHLPGWLAGSEAVLERMLREVPWRADERPMYDRVVAVPRLLAWYGPGDVLPHPALLAAREALDAHYRPVLPGGFVTAGACLYRDGRDSVAWHGDRIGRGATHDTVVAIVSLGSARTLALRPRGGGHALRFPLGHGDLLVMGGSCQRTWDHAVPKTSAHVGPRISVQFRPSGVA